MNANPNNIMNILLTINSENEFFCGINRQQCTGIIDDFEIKFRLGDLEDETFVFTVFNLVKSAKRNSNLKLSISNSII